MHLGSPTEYDVDAMENLGELFRRESPNPIGQKESIDRNDLGRIGH